MHKKKHQMAAPGPRNNVAGGVALPPYVLPYYYLWYGGNSMMAPYGTPGGQNQTAQNDFGKDTDGASTGTGAAAAGGDASAGAVV
jgi:hypothetical protein